jgi:hypothetical protein
LISATRWAISLLDRSLVDLLHEGGRLVLGDPGDLFQLLFGIFEPGPDAFEVEHSEPTELVDQNRGFRADDTIHGGSDQGQVEPVRAKRPADVNVIRVSGPSGRNDGNIVESVSASAFLASADLNFQSMSSRALRVKRGRLRAPADVSTETTPLATSAFSRLTSKAPTLP